MERKKKNNSRKIVHDRRRKQRDNGGAANEEDLLVMKKSSTGHSDQLVPGDGEGGKGGRVFGGGKWRRYEGGTEGKVMEIEWMD